MEDSEIKKIYREIYGKKPEEEQIKQTAEEVSLEILDYLDRLIKRSIPKKINTMDLKNVIEEKDLLTRKEKGTNLKIKRKHEIDYLFLLREYIFEDNKSEEIFENSIDRVIEKYIKKKKESIEDDDMIKL
jgi:hypothetical protein